MYTMYIGVTEKKLRSDKFEILKRNVQARQLVVFTKQPYQNETLVKASWFQIEFLISSFIKK